MRAFGLISLLITVAIAAWWLSSSVGSSTEVSESKQADYQEALNSAREAARSME